MPSDEQLDMAAANAVAVRDRIADDILAGIVDFDSAIAALADLGALAESYTDYGHGFTVLKTTDKTNLVGKPFVIVEWEFHESDKFKTTDGPLEFVSAFCVLKTGQKVILNDGGTGIYRQLREVTRKRIAAGRDPQSVTRGLIVPCGLVASTYETTDEKGLTTEATTYYLSEGLPT